MITRHRAQRFMGTTDPHAFHNIPQVRQAWFETIDEVRAGLRWGRCKAELLQWVRRKMERKLNARERRCIELYYFRGLSYAEAACVARMEASSVLRSVRRSINKLRALAQREGVTLQRGIPKKRPLRSPRPRNSAHARFARPGSSGR